ncbi:hypothetical protein QTU67_002861 [Vibrio cholerae]|uniref:hypothetical protein n=1 Tax=Vibrio cholerae TaxID=666 RepID=UPI0006157C58|nr:hypothetical protein [Vibrio cholerae]AKB05117.1 hypothetical protein VAB027_2460 [Vibrio cholerae]EGQ7879811.1 hypothetical protein [Vibrio cholerae]EGX7706543.1 hypothetical protein [Vibrio cholerae]EHC9837030.1 hypothetical protein [Vibrio cholerae]EHD2262676.1 hypothetical protein [Vibrio cholerae]
MKEYIVTYTVNGRRSKRRVFAYDAGDAYKRVRQEEPLKSSISWLKTEEIK